MPGSISTTTVPALSKPKTSEMKSMPGRTNSASRVPCGTPQSRSPAGDAVAVLVQLAESDRSIAPLALAVVTERFDHGHSVRPGFGLTS